MSPLLRRGTLFSTLAALCYASAVVFIRFAYAAGVLPGTAIFLRFLLGSLVLWLMARLVGRRSAITGIQRMKIFLLGLVAYTVLGVTWFVALKSSPAWLVSLFSALSPLAVNLIGWLFVKESIRGSQLLALAGIVTGVLVLFWRPLGADTLPGVILMTINLLANAMYFWVGKRMMIGAAPLDTAFWLTSGATFGTLIYALASSEFSLAFAFWGWLWILAFAVVSTALAITFLWTGIGLLGPAKASIVGAIEPVFAILLAVLVLGERLTGMQAVGGLLIIGGASLVRYDFQEKHEEVR